MQAFVQGFVSQSVKCEPLDRFRRLRRSLDSSLTFRKFVVLILITLVFFLYIGPAIFAYLFINNNTPFIAHDDVGGSCLNSWLDHHRASMASFDVFLVQKNEDKSNGFNHRNIFPKSNLETNKLNTKSFLPFVGNGHLGLVVSNDYNDDDESKLVIRGQRTLTTRLPFKPLTYPKDTTLIRSNATVISLKEGVVERVECLRQRLFFATKVFASRSVKNLLIQEVSLVNPGDHVVEVDLRRQSTRFPVDWKSTAIQLEASNEEYMLHSGPVMTTDDESKSSSLYFREVAIVVPKDLPKIIVGARMSKTAYIYTSVSYSKPVKRNDLDKNKESIKKTVENEAIEALKQGLRLGGSWLHYRHISSWQATFTTGFGISQSMLEEAVNGDVINATMYYVMSHLSAPLHELQTTEDLKRELRNKIAYPEGCFNGLPTLQAKTLWGDLSTSASVEAIVQKWLLTLEKNGCLKLLKAGADGGIQAMVLSLGSLLFKEEHLELNARPQDLHRDIFFRRLSYTENNHLNVSVVVHEESHKANLYVGIENDGDNEFYGCDAGCLDRPVALSSSSMHFPVKLTEPLTAILYVTADKKHMEELKHAIHVHEVAEAPPHEAHVIDQHRHGNRIGGLPTLFWLSLAVPVLMFHGFLFKLIWQEYCASTDKFRVRKYSDYE